MTRPGGRPAGGRAHGDDGDEVGDDDRAGGAVPGTDGVVERLAAAAEELADLALDRLQQAVTDAAPDGEEARSLAADERRITRARRAVERAVAILGGAPGV